MNRKPAVISTSSILPREAVVPAGAGQTPHALPRVRAAGILAFLAFAAMLYGSKLWVIGAYGNATPYWDQWPGEASFLYHPLVAGTLRWSNLLAPSNEHRIFTARLLNLARLKLNGIWNPLLQMVVNAALHVLTLCLLIAMLARTIGRDQLPALLLFALLLFSVPYAWENTLWGYQAHFYFVLFFSVACLWLTATREPLSVAWWAGLACAVLAFLSFGSGVCAARGGRGPWSCSLRAGIAADPQAVARRRHSCRSSDTRRRADSVAAVSCRVEGRFGRAVPLCLDVDPRLADFFQVLLALIVNLPALVFVGIVLRRRPVASSGDWFLTVLVVWVFIQDASVAYGRAAGFRPARYLDLYAIGVFANFACALRLALDRVKQPYGWRIPAVAVWCGVILISLGVSARRNLPDDLAARRNSAIAQETNTRAYLATGDFKHLKDKPLFHVPYPDAKILASFLATPEIRQSCRPIFAPMPKGVG